MLFAPLAAGNKRFRVLCEMNLDRYTAATTKIEKSLIVMSIVDTIRDAGGDDGKGTGGFVKEDVQTGRWYEISEAAAREKVGQKLREILSRRKGGRKPKVSQTLMNQRSPSPVIPLPTAEPLRQTSLDIISSLISDPEDGSDDESIGSCHSHVNQDFPSDDFSWNGPDLELSPEVIQAIEQDFATDIISV